jgi:hypothetical protein
VLLGDEIVQRLNISLVTARNMLMSNARLEHSMRLYEHPGKSDEFRKSRRSTGLDQAVTRRDSLKPAIMK